MHYNSSIVRILECDSIKFYFWKALTYSIAFKIRLGRSFTKINDFGKQASHRNRYTGK
jgi:hypothetical protein